jgi:hypothetical protein
MSFFSRGCKHGSDLDDWLNAERQLSPAADGVLVTRSEAGFDISIAERAQQERIFLSIAPSSLLVLWTEAGTNSNEQNLSFKSSTLSLASLPEPADPARAEVTYRDGRVGTPSGTGEAALRARCLLPPRQPICRKIPWAFVCAAGFPNNEIDLMPQA